jgi:hypothetical protein
MTKKDAAKIFGGTNKSLANAVGVSNSAVSQWPDQLPQDLIDRLIGAAIRLGKAVPGVLEAGSQRSLQHSENQSNAA